MGRIVAHLIVENISDRKVLAVLWGLKVDKSAIQRIYCAWSKVYFEDTDWQIKIAAAKTVFNFGRYSFTQIQDPSRFFRLAPVLVCGPRC